MSRGASAVRQREQPRRRWRSTARVCAGGSWEVPKAFSWKMVGCMMGVEGSSPLPSRPGVQGSIREGRPERCGRGGQESPFGCGYPIAAGRRRAAGREFRRALLGGERRGGGGRDDRGDGGGVADRHP